MAKPDGDLRFAAALVACYARLSSGSLGARRLFDAVNEALVCETWPTYAERAK